MTFKEKLAVLVLLLAAQICAPEPHAAKVADLARDIRLWAKES